MEKAQPDVLCLNETKVDEEALEKEEIKKYVARWFPLNLQFWNSVKPPRKGYRGFGYSGTAIFVSKTFKGGIPQKVEYDFGEEGFHDLEGRTITCHFNSFILVTTYVPNSGFPGLQRLEYRVNCWDKDFHHFVKEELEREHKKPVILAGDMNVVHKDIDIYRSLGVER